MQHEEEICVRHISILLAEPIAIDDADDRGVDAVVPVSRDLDLFQDSTLLAHEVKAVDLEVLEQLEVERRPTRRHTHSPPSLGEAALFEEDALELSEDDLEQVRSGRQRNGGHELGDVGIDRLLAISACERDAVVTVDHEVGISELHRDDRWKAAVGKRALERAQAVAAERLPRLEPTRERAAAAIRADDVLDRNDADAEITARERLEPSLDILEVEKVAVGGSPPSHR